MSMQIELRIVVLIRTQILIRLRKKLKYISFDENIFFMRSRVWKFAIQEAKLYIESLHKTSTFTYSNVDTQFDPPALTNHAKIPMVGDNFQLRSVNGLEKKSVAWCKNETGPIVCHLLWTQHPRAIAIPRKFESNRNHRLVKSRLTQNTTPQSVISDAWIF